MKVGHARMCNTNNCSSSIATQKPELRSPLKVDEAVEYQEGFLQGANELIRFLPRACGHDHISQLNCEDLSTRRDMDELNGTHYACVGLD